MKNIIVFFIIFAVVLESVRLILYGTKAYKKLFLNIKNKVKEEFKKYKNKER